MIRHKHEKTKLVQCSYCHKEFYLREGWIRKKKDKDKHFCSRQHYWAFKKGATLETREGRVCKYCNAMLSCFRGTATFCNRSCAAKFNNSKRKAYRRSKVETLFFTLLTERYPQLNIIANDKTMLDGKEVDIAIPQLKLAIEWNGIVHFKPVYGETKLEQIQQRDAKKLLVAAEKDINLIVISDFSSTEGFVKSQFNQVCTIIDSLL